MNIARTHFRAAAGGADLPQKPTHNSELSRLPKSQKNIGSNRILQNRQLLLDFKIPYDFVAKGEQNESKNLTFPKWWAGRDLRSRLPPNAAGSIVQGQR